MTDESRPLVSVVIPMHNSERYVRASLESVLAQTYENIDVVLVDDASTDDSRAALASTLEDSRVRYIRNGRNLGQFGTVNVGLAAAWGELIAVHHDDDVMLPQRLQRQAAWLAAHPEAGAVFATDLYIDPCGREFGRTTLPAELRGVEVLEYPVVLDTLLRYGNVFLRTPTNLVRATVYREVGAYSEEWALRGDIEMWLRLARRGPIGLLDEPLVQYRWGHENESARYGRRRTEPELTFELLDRVLAADGDLVEPVALRAHEGRRAEDFLLVAVNRYLSGDRRAARRALRCAQLGRITGTRYVRRTRLLVLWSALRVLLLLPRLRVVAAALERRYDRRLDEGRA